MRLPRPALLCVLALASCTPGPSRAPTPAPPEPVTISILSTNDVHGQLAKVPILAGYVANLRRARERDGAVLLVDAGDAFQGTIESNSNEGAAIIAAYDALGYRAFALGNHEFDYGPAGPAGIPEAPGDDPRGALVARLSEAHFPVLSANLRDEKGQRPNWPNFADSAILNVRGIRVGVIGLLTAEADQIVKRPLFRNLHTTPLTDAATREAARLRAQGATVVIVLAHAGGACKDTDSPFDLSSCEANSEIFELARSLPPGSVDAIFGGHRNAAVAHVVSGIPIAHAPSHLVAFSRIDLVVDGATKTVKERRVLPPHALCKDAKAPVCIPDSYEGAPVMPDERVAKVIAPALESARAVRERPVGVRVIAPFVPSKAEEMALNDLFADLMRGAVPGADAAFTNSGSVRDILPQGDLTFGELYHVMPFDNQLAVLKMKGEMLREVLRANLTQREHGLVALSGLRAEARCVSGQLTIDILRPNGSKLGDADEISVVTSDFLAWGGDGLLSRAGLSDDRIRLVPGEKVIDVLSRGLAARGTVSPNDRALFDPEHPRVRLPGPLPITCR